MSWLDLRIEVEEFVPLVRRLAVFCFERQVVKVGSDSALPCPATLSSVPTRRLEKSRED